MAQNPDQILINFNVADANYPGGSLKDVSAPAATDGSEIIASQLNDLQGYFQRLLEEASIVGSGAPDTILVSQYYDSLLFIILRELGLSSLRSFPTVAAMVAVTDLSVGDFVATESYLAGKNKGGAIYAVVAAGTGTIDGGEFIALAGPTNFQAKLIPAIVVTASQYGATGAGDDTTEIKALFDSPFANILVDTTSTITGTGLSVSGAKKRIGFDTILSYIGSGACITVLTTGADSILDFSANGFLLGNNVTATQVGIKLSTVDHVQIISAQIANFLETGIELNASNDCMISGSEITGSDNTAGILITGTTSINNKLENLNLDNNKVGLFIKGGQRNESNHITTNNCAEAGIRLDAITTGAGNGAKFNTFIDVECDSSGGASFGGIAIREDSNHNVFIRPVCRSNTGQGILVQGIVGFKPVGNRLISALCSGNVTGIFTFLCLQLEIQNSTLINNTVRGLLTEDSEDIKIFGGLIDNNTSDGIRHKSSLRTLENGVTITNNGGTGVLIDDTGSLTPESFRTLNCHILGNTTAPYTVSGTGLEDAKAMNCTGFVTDNRGIEGVTLTLGSGTIAHGLSGTPSVVHLTVVGKGLIVDVNGLNATNITVTVVDDTGANESTATVHWEAHLF